jgi:glutamate racemase
VSRSGVEQIEEGALDSPETMALLRGYVTPLLDAGADTIVLGCTHYPLLVPQLRAIAGDDTLILDAAPAVAQRVAQIVQERGLMRNVNTLSGAITCATTGDPERFANLIHRLDLPCDRVEQAVITIDA